MGVVVGAVLQNSAKSDSKLYPGGKSGTEFTATTTVANAWEILTFTPSATPNTGLNEIILLISPSTTTKRKVYLDDWTGPSLMGFVAATRNVKTATAAFAPAYPNPTSGTTQLPYTLLQPAVVSLIVSIT